MSKQNQKKEANIYDKVFKENIDAVIDNIIRKILKIEIVHSEKIIAKLQRTHEREADYLEKVIDKNGNEFILHIEYQTHNETNMVHRMLDYCSLLLRKYKLPVEQYVIFLGEGKPTMTTKISYRNIHFNYHLIDIKRIDYHEFVNSETPEEILLAILADFKKQSLQNVVEEIVNKLDKTVDLSLESEKLFQQLLVFGRLRNLQEKIQEIMNSISKYIDIKEDFLYKQGLEQGIEQGLEQGIEQGIEQGVELGLEQGIEKGVEKTVLNFLIKSDLSIEQIADYAGVTLTYVIAIKQKYNL
jgi:predicted transposase/invertase (TIGR01784 family)